VSQNYRALFEFDPEIIYLNHASTGMLPKKSAEAMKEYIDALASAGEPSMDGLMAMQQAFRDHAANLLDVESHEIAFIRNTTDGLSLALHSIDWKPGDNMVVQEDAFPACLYVAAYCFPQVEKRYVPLRDGSDFYERLNQQIDNRTRAVVVDYVHFLSGFRLDLKQLGELKQYRNFYLIVDGIQGLGAVQVSLKDTNVDFFSAGGVKWLNAPAGTGIFYLRQEILKELIPFHVGWASAEYENVNSFYPVRPLYSDSRRFQAANENFIGMNGLVESLKMVHEIGTEKIENNIMAVTEKAISMLKEKGFILLTPDQKINHAGIVTFKHPKIASQKIFEHLQKRRIVCSLREGYVRLAFHFYNTEEELQQVVSHIEEIISN
jgi:selenocysteine lyase/cysteine desulfurase